MAAVAQDPKPAIRINAPEALKPRRPRNETHTTIHSGVNHFGFSKKRENAAKLAANAEIKRREDEIEHMMSLPESVVTPEQMKAGLEAYIAAVKARSRCLTYVVSISLFKSLSPVTLIFSEVNVSGLMLYCIIKCGYNEFKSKDAIHL